MAPRDWPSVSIVICTDGRAEALRRTLDSLKYLDYDNFEVIVVSGPTEDGTDGVLANWNGQIKVAHNPERNLSISRNIGIQLSCGDIVAFLDDDGLPEHEWLKQICAAYDDPSIGAVGGFVYNPDGYTYQYKFATVNRLATANLSWDRATPEFNFPYSFDFPHLLGANSSFRRAALLQVGGFDEEYEYYLDETDVTLRIVDAGWSVGQVAGAHVHHKFMPSHIRNDAKVLTNWFPIFKNKIYFCLTHARDYRSLRDIMANCWEFIEQHRKGMEWCIANDLLEPEFSEKFDIDTERAWIEAMRAVSRDTTRIPGGRYWNDKVTSFLPFRKLLPKGTTAKTYCLISQSYPPGPVGGIGRYVHQLATEIAATGHNVHVITKSNAQDTIDFEDGVWVHRVVPEINTMFCSKFPELPDHIAAYCLRVSKEVDDLLVARPIQAVYCPTWDCEGYALLNDKRFPLVLSLQTTLKAYLKSNEHLGSDDGFMKDFGEPMLAAERHMFQHSDGIHANSGAIAKDISRDYDFEFSSEKLSIIGLGAEDWARDFPPQISEEKPVKLLFVGRLEPRKAVDIVLQASLNLLIRHPDLVLDVVGDYTLPWYGGAPYRSIFEQHESFEEVKNRILFHGQVSDHELRKFYANCDILVTPSRYESFGLMLLEGMMFGKVVIGARAGGMPEVVKDGVTGFLVEPGNTNDLIDCLDNLIADPALREKIGTQARTSFEENFTSSAMASGIQSFMDSVALKHRTAVCGTSTSKGK